MTRAAINAFELANPLYKNATVSFYTVASGVKTATLATLYSGITGSAQLANPQKLNSRGQFKQSVYIESQVIGEVEGISVPGHDTAIYSPDAPTFRVQQSTAKLQYSYDGGISYIDTGDMIFRNRGLWATATDYVRNDMVFQSGVSYLCLEAHTSGVFATDLAASKWQQIVADIGFIQSGPGAGWRTMQDARRDIVSVLDYGVVPDDSSDATRSANVTALRKLVSTAANGGVFAYKGWVLFPLGKDYWFDDIIPPKDGIYFELAGSTLHFKRVAATGTDTLTNYGFITPRRDFGIQNGYIDVDYDGTLSSSSGSAIQINQRGKDNAQPGQWLTNNFEEDQAAGGTGTGPNGTGVMRWMPGNVSLRNLRISSNNPATAMIETIGGIKNMEIDNVELDGGGVAPTGLDYEFGFATDEAAVINDLNSYFANFSIRNFIVRNITGTAIDMRCPYNLSTDNVFCDSVGSCISISTGEAGNFAPGVTDAIGIGHNIYLRNTVGQGVTNNGIVIAGITSWLGGYRASAYPTQTELQTVDLLSATIDGFVLSQTVAAGDGIGVNGKKISIRNGSISGFYDGVYDSGTRNLHLDDVDILDTATQGLRVINGNAYIAGWTDKSLRVRGGTIAGNGTGAGIGILIERSCGNAVIEDVTFGYMNRATAEFDITGGTASPGVNKITTITVNGVDVLAGTPVDWVTSNTATATAVAAAINAAVSAPEYSAASSGTTVLIRAASSAGTTPNGYAVVANVAGNVTVANTKPMSGGLLEVNQANSVSMNYSATLVNNPQNVTVRHCNTRGTAGGGTAYANQCTVAASGNRLEGNYGIVTTFSGSWLSDTDSFTGTLTGVDAVVTGKVLAAVSDNTITLSVPQFGGTSNTTAKTITGMSQRLWPAAATTYTCYVSSDNGGTVAIGQARVETTGVITLYPTSAYGNWTAANACVVRAFQLTYTLAG